MDKRFELLLFSIDTQMIRTAAAAGIDGFIVDWESRGKHLRQKEADTQINSHTVDDLRRVRASTDSLVLCRINSYSKLTANEIELAIAAGADEILLPMVRSADEVESVLSLASNRIGVGILIETVAAVKSAAELGGLPITRAYVGLNDLAIDRQSGSIFSAVADNIVEQVRQCVKAPFGFAGLTLPGCGNPIPCRLLISEMARLKCDFTFLRRSFYRDIAGRSIEVEIPRLREAIETAWQRDPDTIIHDHCALLDSIQDWPEKPMKNGESES